MGEKLKILYEYLLKPAAKIITAPFIMPTAVRKRIERAVSLGESIDVSTGYSFEKYSPSMDAAILGGLITGGTLNSVSLAKSIQSFSEGRTIEGLAFMAPIATNVLSGLYEVYKWVERKEKGQPLLPEEYKSGTF